MDIKVVPGQYICPETQYKSGPGTTTFKGRIHSSLIGVTRVVQEGDQAQITVISSKKIGTATDLPTVTSQVNLLPQIGDVVLAKIDRISRLQANAQIIVIGETALADDFQGVIRTADVRAHEVDKVKIASSFKPGDIVRAEVISLGDQSSYFLSTAKNELGVLFAWNDLGEMMSPLSWNQMSSESGLVEERKVAKPFI